ncbi:MAG TPA: ABC transporter permease [Acidimicrobiia bacterium]|nr:ABC transporter permease [Acidimicrobiia bacterium]
MRAPAFARVVEREMRVFRRLWRGTAFSGLVTPLLYLGAMGFGLGGLVDERTGDVDGLSYLVFVTPGLLAASAMQTAANNSLWPVMAGTKWIRSYHAMVASPLSPGDVYGGFVVWNSMRTSLYSGSFLVVAAALGGVTSFWAVVALPFAVLTGAAFAAPLGAFAASRDTDQSFPLIVRLGIMPLFLFSGTFFPLDLLPGWLATLAVISPLWHGAELCRAATTGSLALGPAAVHVAVLAAVIAVAWRFGTRSFTRKLTP